MELWRRWILLYCTIVGLVLAMFVSLSPKVSLKAIDFANRQKYEFGFDERADYLRQLPLPEYIQEKTANHRITVAGEGWSQFLDEVLAASHGEQTAGPLQSRVCIEDRFASPPFGVFFQPEEAPVADLVDQLRSTVGEPWYVVLQHPDGPVYVQAIYHTYHSDDFGFTSRPSNLPPASLYYPYRPVGYVMLSLGLLVYIFLPRKKRDANTIGYAHWSVIPGDFAGLLLFVPFFVLPMFVGGGAVQALTVTWIITLVLWPLAGLGAWLLIHMTEYATYEIVVGEDGIEVRTLRGRTTCRFDSMVSLQPLSLRTPQWLIWLTRLGAIAGSGSDRFRLAGQSLALDSSATPGFAIRLRDDSAVYIWLPTHTNDKIVKNAQRLGDALEAAAIPRIEEVRVVRAIVRPDGEGPHGTKLKQTQSKVLAGLIILPLAMLGVLLAGWWTTETFDFSADVSPAADADAQNQAAVARFSENDVRWERRFRAGSSPMLISTFEQFDALGVETADAPAEQDSYACGLLQLAGGELLIYGAAGPSSYIDGYVLQTAESGEKQWENHYGVEGKSLEYITGACAGRDGKLLLWGTSGSYSRIMGGSRTYLVGISAAGERLWELAWGEGTDFPTPDSAVLRPDGSFTVYGHAGSEPSTTIFILQVDEAGKLIAEKQIDARAEIGDVDIRQVAATKEGGFVVTGEIAEPDQYKNLLLARFNAEGQLDWKQSFGGPKLESGRIVLETPDGHLLAVGEVDTFDDQLKLIVVRTDPLGQPVWERTIAKTGQNRVNDARWTAGDGLLLAGEFRPSPDSLPQLLVMQLDAKGDVEWEKRLSQPDVVYSSPCAIRTSAGNTLVVATRSWGNQDLNAISLIQITP